MRRDKRFDYYCMQRAVEVAKQCKPEDGRDRPLVGVVVAKNGHVLTIVHRNEDGKGQHAEYRALEHNRPGVDLRGATVYTTLEPCTSRKDPKRPCSEWLAVRGVSRVVIGMLDPNREIRGKGEWYLFERQTRIGRFPHGLAQDIRSINRGFIAAQQRPGFRINEPSDGAPIPLGPGRISGSYVTWPEHGAFVIAKADGRYWPQSEAVCVDAEARLWEASFSCDSTLTHDLGVYVTNRAGSDLVHYYLRNQTYRDNILRNAYEYMRELGQSVSFQDVLIRVAPRFHSIESLTKDFERQDLVRVHPERRTP